MVEAASTLIKDETEAHGMEGGLMLERSPSRPRGSGVTRNIENERKPSSNAVASGFVKSGAAPCANHVSASGQARPNIATAPAAWAARANPRRRVEPQVDGERTGDRDRRLSTICGARFL